MHLSAEQISALHRLSSVVGDEAIVLVGAAALGFHLDMRWRHTHDLDVLVMMTPECQSLDAEGDLGWIRDARVPHRWTTREQVLVDVLSIARQELDFGKKLWPDGTQMNLMGVDLAFRSSAPRRMSEDESVRVASLPALGFLKMVSYLDRPGERENDLADLAFILEESLDADEPRRFGREIVDLGLEYDATVAYLRGEDISRVLKAEERPTVNAFLAKLLDDDDPDQSGIRMARHGPSNWERDVENLILRLNAFQSGFARTPSGET